MNKVTLKDKAKALVTTIKFKVGTAVSTGALSAIGMTVAASADNTDVSGAGFTVPNIADSITTASFNGILDQFGNILPIALPVVVGGVAIRKGLGFMLGLIRGI